MSGIWRCLGKHRVTWDLASLSPVQVGLLPDHQAVELGVMDLEAGKSSQRRPCAWSWLRPPFGLADIPIRARGMRRIRTAASLRFTLFGVYHAPWSFMLTRRLQPARVGFW
jgi:hypothetical protein